MISMVSADTSNRGDSLSSSLVILASGAAGDCAAKGVLVGVLYELDRRRGVRP